MRGIFKLNVRARTGSNSARYIDKWITLDKLKFTSISTNIKGHTKFKVDSMNRGFPSFIISKDELAFVKLIYNYYGFNNYCILIWGTGKTHGLRPFWDGLITLDKKFIRKRNTGYWKEHSSALEKSSFSISENQLTKHMKTKRPGVWYNF